MSLLSKALVGLTVAAVVITGAVVPSFAAKQKKMEKPKMIRDIGTTLDEGIIEEDDIIDDDEIINSITIDVKNTGVELVRTSEATVSFEYLGVDDESLYDVTDTLVDGVLEISIVNNDPDFSSTNFAPDYKNVVKINIPDQEYSELNITTNKAPLLMQDINATVSFDGTMSGMSLVDTEITRGTYHIVNYRGNVNVTADTIAKDIEINNSGSVTVTFNEVPENLYLDLMECRYVTVPNGWSPSITKFGDETPVITVKNSGATVVISK